MSKTKTGNRVLMIPDTQVKPGVPTSHIEAAGNLIVDMKPDTVVMIGDWWDMPSLSGYEERQSAYFHDKTYRGDVDAGLDGMVRLLTPLWRYNSRALRNRKRKYQPRLVFCMGNHEHRIVRAVHKDPRLKGAIGLQDLQLEKMGWEVHDFLEIVEIDKILYSHYFCNPLSLKKNPLGGTIENRLQKIGQSFSMGHQQIYQHGMIHDAMGRARVGLVWGCLTPDHKVLTADLKYKPIGELEVGEKLVSFDEDSGVDGKRSRRYKTGTLLQKKHEVQDVYAVTLKSGKVFKTTADHAWLYKQGSWYKWIQTDQLREGMKIPKLFDEWEQDKSFDSGWLCGMYDGEGSLSARSTTGGSVMQLSISQKEGPTLEKIKKLIKDICGDDNTTHTIHGEVRQLRIKGGTNNIAKVLGILRPERLLAKFRPENLGRINRIIEKDDFVESVEYIGRREIVKTDVDAKTMIVEGYPHHNCFYQHDEEYAGPQGNHRFDGVMLKNEVKDGFYCGCPLSMDYLLEKYL